MKSDKILLDHGSGGKLSQSLISDIMLPIFNNNILSRLDDGAVFHLDGKRYAFSTDTFVVDPIFFPGGNIGDLSINGTVNDLAMCGAVPLFLSAGLVIEEGFLITDLNKILKCMGLSAEKAGVTVVTGDTKVVPKGSGDKIFINTSGIGRIPDPVNISSQNACPGQKIILSGTIGDHGIAVLTHREGLNIDSPIVSDTAPLNHVVKKMLSACHDIHVLRDPTRGGIATVLNEIAKKSNIGIQIFEEKIPVDRAVAGVCELLGLDPLYVPNEGKFLAFIGPDHASEILALLRKEGLGKNASIIGEVVGDYAGRVFMETSIGGTRLIDMPTGEQFPRIC
jgi:hydrogenase expression/formation protein HypE